MGEPDGPALPPWPRTQSGTTRRIGVEIEFAGLDVDGASRVVAACFDGAHRALSEYEHVIDVARWGEFRVELDFEALKTLGRERAGGEQAILEYALAEIARQVVPLEVVTPPLPMDRLAVLDPLVERLRAAGARGTRESPFYAFGLHLNPEVPRIDADTVLAYIQAFLCLADWLVRENDVDWSRRMTPYVNAFPAEYARRVVAPGYTPDLDTLMDDYLRWNADRNRALDLLPLLAHIDAGRVRAAIDDPRIKPRPALHYRLANCDIDRPGWTLAEPWGLWMEVERLAADPTRRAGIADAYRAHLDAFTSRAFGDWATAASQWIARG